ncbi:mitotic interactor and substrate of PLK1 isoform X2 [Leptodactylus fuscus]|uniref:mitotic interactor and substrate of PLK1 isoform X2 n=1 Tax=Leptodactylus fuscus TaxID=238119 RepID=UPI003F4F3120
MFKYPSPWQVLCSSIERREQVPENGEDGNTNFSNKVKETTVENHVTDRSAFHLKISTDYQIISTPESLAHKELKPELIIISNISESEQEVAAKGDPTLQESSIHADSGKTYVPEEQGANVTESQTNTVTLESTMDRVTRRMFSSFSSPTLSINGSQQDLVNSCKESQADEIDNRNNMWVSSPERRLKVIREEERFEIRSQLPETSPTKLFLDSDEDENYKVKPQSCELTPEKIVDLEKKRRDIIKKQGQRISLDAEDIIAISNTNDSLISNTELTAVESSRNNPNIHTEQIHFESVRQQFLKLEQERNILPITPRPPPRQSQFNTPSLHETYQLTKEQEGQHNKLHKDEETIQGDLSSSLLRKQFFKTLSVDNEEQEKSAQETQEERESIPNPADETPIEREIRLALQREENLRKERGIVSLGETKEIIEISKNPVLNLPDMQDYKKIKNRPSTSLFIQREIEKEVQREADLKSEGRVVGLYDKGNSEELDKRRKLFEQPDEIPVQPATATKDIVTDKDTKSYNTLDSPQPYSVRMKWKPAPFNAYRNRRLSADNILDIKTPQERTSEKESEEEALVLPKENFHIQPLKFCLRVEDNEGVVERDRKIGSTERYSIRLKPSISNIIEQEIQKTLQRDRELHEERRKSGLLPLTIQNDHKLNTPQNGYDTYKTSSSLTSNCGIHPCESAQKYNGTTLGSWPICQ